MLIPLLDCHSFDLLLLVTSFLKKLSLYDENLEQMHDLNIVPLLVKFIPCSHEALTHMTLGLLYNLSFDARLRANMASRVVGFSKANSTC